MRIFGKAILSPERKFFPKYSKGVYSIGGMKLLVSAGLGKFRVFDPAEIVVYEI
jgi:predicted MPP superfamily phosphohydrolase